MLTFTVAMSGESNVDELLTSLNALSAPVGGENIWPHVRQWAAGVRALLPKWHYFGLQVARTNGLA